MKSFTKRITAFLLAFLIIFATGVAAMPEKKAQAAESYDATIWKSWVKLRTKRSKAKSSKVIRKISKGESVQVFYTKGNWRRVSYQGQTGWVLKKYVYINTNAPELTDEQTVEAKGSTVASFAQRFIGNPYVWGGTNLNSGADCSGFIGAVYRSFGYSLPRTSSDLRGVGTKVTAKDIQPGDIVCYSGHVAMYIGDGKIVHASTRKTGIKISNNYRYRRVVAIRRVVK